MLCLVCCCHIYFATQRWTGSVVRVHAAFRQRRVWWMRRSRRLHNRVWSDNDQRCMQKDGRKTDSRAGQACSETEVNGLIAPVCCCCCSCGGGGAKSSIGRKSWQLFGRRPRTVCSRGVWSTTTFAATAAKWATGHGWSAAPTLASRDGKLHKIISF